MGESKWVTVSRVRFCRESAPQMIGEGRPVRREHRKPSRKQRIRQVPTELKDQLASMTDDEVLGVHDYTHDLMEARHNGPQRKP